MQWNYYMAITHYTRIRMKCDMHGSNMFYAWERHAMRVGTTCYIHSTAVIMMLWLPERAEGAHAVSPSLGRPGLAPAASAPQSHQI